MMLLMKVILIVVNRLVRNLDKIINIVYRMENFKIDYDCFKSELTKNKDGLVYKFYDNIKIDNKRNKILSNYEDMLEKLDNYCNNYFNVDTEFFL